LGLPGAGDEGVPAVAGNGVGGDLNVAGSADMDPVGLPPGGRIIGALQGVTELQADSKRYLSPELYQIPSGISKKLASTTPGSGL